MTLDLRDLTCRRDGRAVIEGVDLRIGAGEFVGLLGPNGAGKTTLFNVITGLLSPSAGEITFRGRRVEGDPAYKRSPIGMARTFQIVRLFSGMSVIENVMVGGFRGTTDRRIAARRAEAALRMLDMWDQRARPASALTLPDRKRLEVARALATEPKLLLLDEVMAGLRPTETDQMVAAFHRLNREHGVTILLIEHVMRAVMALAQRVYVLHHGVIISSGTPAQVTSDPKVLESYLGTAELS